MSHLQNAGQNQNLMIANKFFKNVVKFMYLGMTLTDQNFIHEEIKSTLNSGNACYHKVQNLLSFSLLCENLQIKIYRTVNFICCFA